MIFGIVGFIGSGKGTVGDILVNEYAFSKHAFADSLKDAVSVIFGWDRSALEGDTEASRTFREQIDPWWSERLGFEVTPRLILQRMGTEACRHGIADNIWIAALEKRIAGDLCPLKKKWTRCISLKLLGQSPLSITSFITTGRLTS